MIVTARDLSNFYGVQKPQISEWIQQGCPVIEPEGGRKPGREDKFETKAVSKWREKRAVIAATQDEFMHKEEAQRRKLQAEAALAELDLAKKMGVVADLDDIERTLKHRFAQFMTTMRKLPERTVLQMIGSTEDEMKSILLEEIDAALMVLSNGVADAEEEI